MGSVAGTLLFWALDEQQIQAWGWRLPFLAGLSVALAGLYLRRNLVLDTHVPKSDARVFRSFIGEWRACLRVIGLMTAPSIGFYMVFIYLVQYLQEIGGLSGGEAFDINR